MRPSVLVCALFSLSAVSAGPLLRERQEGDNEGTTVTPGPGGASESSTVPIASDPSSPIPPSSISVPPQISPSPPSTNPAPENDCPPCTAEGYRTRTSPSGRTCYCLDGTTEPWSWSDKTCISDTVGLPNEEGRPYFCLGSGDSPSSRACLSNCNFMLNTVNSVNPCNTNLYNAARSCASCVPGGAIHYQLDGKSPAGPYINGDSSMNTFMDGLKNWCALPSRCLNLATGGRVSGTGGCPVIAENNPGKPSQDTGDSSTTLRSVGASTSVREGAGSTEPPTAVRSALASASSSSPLTVPTRDSSIARPGPGSTGSSRVGGTNVPAKIVVTSTISTTDAQGRPTFSVALATVDNPDFTGNTVFAGARPSASAEGGALTGRELCWVSALLAALATILVVA